MPQPFPTAEELQTPLAEVRRKLGSMIAELDAWTELLAELEQCAEAARDDELDDVLALLRREDSRAILCADAERQTVISELCRSLTAGDHRR